MAIWKAKLTIEEIEEKTRNTIADHLGIRVTEIGDDYIKGTMPVDEHTRQPRGLLHGGASVVLAESIGSLATRMLLEPGFNCVGLEINANHIRSAREGLVTGVAKPIHIGKSTHVWDIRIYHDDKIITICRLTMAVFKESQPDQT